VAIRRPTGLQRVSRSSAIPSPVETPRVQPSAHPPDKEAVHASYWSFDRDLTVGASALATVGGIAGVALAATAAAPVTAAGAVIYTVGVIGSTASAAMGVMGTIIGFGAKDPGSEARVLGEASRFIEPDELAVKLLDKATGAGGKLEDLYDIAHAIKELYHVVEPAELAKFVKELADQADAAKTLIEHMNEQHAQGASQASQTEKERRSASPGSENNHNVNQ
jgi:hypothetical protein